MWDFGGIAGGKRSVGRPRHGWEDNLKMDLKIGLGGVCWADIARDRDYWNALVNTVMNLRFP
jgi:hypothetical protein